MSGEVIGIDGLSDQQREGARLAAAGWRGVDIAELRAQLSLTHLREIVAFDDPPSADSQGLTIICSFSLALVSVFPKNRACDFHHTPLKP